MTRKVVRDLQNTGSWIITVFRQGPNVKNQIDCDAAPGGAFTGGTVIFKRGGLVGGKRAPLGRSFGLFVGKNLSKISCF